MLTISDKLNKFITKIYPDFNLSFNWVIPEVPINIKGVPAQLSSDALIRFAQLCQVSPDSLAEKIKSELASLEDEFLISLDYGYLNLAFTSYSQELFKDFERDPEILIFFPTQQVGRTDAEFIRLLSLAISQLIFSNHKKELVAFTEQSFNSYPKVTKDLLQINRELGDFNFASKLIELIKELPLHANIHSTLWLSPEQTSKKQVSQLYREVTTLLPNLQIQIPHASWLKDLDSEIVSKFKNISDQRDLIKLVLLLSSNLPSSELYFDEAMIPSRNNLIWYLDATYQRVSSLGISPKRWQSDFQLEALPDPLKKIFWQIILLPVARQEAVRHGEIAKFFSKIYDFLDSFNLYFNSPELRLKLLQDECNNYELELMSAGLEIVSQLKASVEDALG